MNHKKYNYVNRTLPIYVKVLFYLIGMLFLGVGIALSLRSNIGAGSFDSLHYAISEALDVTVGQAMYLVAAVMITYVTVFNRDPKKLLIIIIVLIVPRLVDLFYYDLIPDLTGLLSIRIAIFLLSMVTILLGATLLVVSTFPAGIVEEFMLVIMKQLNIKNVMIVRFTIEIITVIISYVIGVIWNESVHQIGIGTILFMVLTGPIIAQLLSFFERIGIYDAN
jgi:uncharacterized membrane protein YczE